MRSLEITNSMGWSGGAQQALVLCEGLKNKGHEVILACPAGSDIEKIARIKGIKIETVNMRQEYDIFAVLKLRKIIKKYNIEIVHAHHPKAHALGLVASLITRVPVFIYTRRVIFPIRKAIFSQLKYKSKRIDKIIAVCEGVKKVLVEYGIQPSRIQIIYGGYDLEKIVSKGKEGNRIRKEFNIKDKELLVSLVGNYSYYKGHTFFLEAVPLILKKVPQAKFILAGRDTDGEELCTLADKLNIKNSLILAGFRTDVPDILAASDITVNASLQEALAGTIIEAFALSKPVIATNVGGNGEAIINKETGLLIPPADAKALAEAVVQLLSDQDLARKMGKKGYLLAKAKFSLDNMVKQTEKLYEQLLKIKKGSRVQDTGSRVGI
jgi:L-malate glycosyltransferase